MRESDRRLVRAWSVGLVLSIVGTVLAAPAIAQLVDPGTTTTVPPYGSVAVAVAVVGTPGPGEGYPFTVTVSCGTAVLPAGGVLTFGGPSGPQTIPGIPVGIRCTAVETGAGGADQVAVTPAAGVTIAEGSTSTLTVTNTFVASPPTTTDPPTTTLPPPTTDPPTTTLPPDPTLPPTTTAPDDGTPDASTPGAPGETGKKKDPSEDDDPPLTREEEVALSQDYAETLSEQVLRAYGGRHGDDGEISVKKKVSSGSTRQRFTFSLIGPSCPTATSCTADLRDGEWKEWDGLRDGTYTLTETLPPGWVVDEVSCLPRSNTTNANPATITLPQPWWIRDPPHPRCTVTNRQLGSTIKVAKATDPQGSPQGFDFRLKQGYSTIGTVTGQRDGQAPSMISPGQVGPGTYRVFEDPVAGWSSIGASCDDTKTAGVEAESPSALVVGYDQAWVCTFRNRLSTATIEVVKKVDGVQAGGWTIDATDPSWPATVAPGSVVTTGSGAPAFTMSRVDRDGSRVHLAERPQPGYRAGVVTCSGPRGTQTGWDGAIDVVAKPGETLRCTFQNVTNTATIQVVKQVDGVQAGGWTVDASDPSWPASVSPGSVVTRPDATTDFAVSRVGSYGTSVHLAERRQPGYRTGPVTCTGPRSAQSGGRGAIDLHVRAGETWRCTFANTVNTATVRVIKKVDGQQVGGWTIDATNPSPPMAVAPASVQTRANATADVGLRLVDYHGSTLRLTERPQTGFTPGSVTCSRDDAPNQTGTSGTIDLTVRPDQTWTCVFTNTTNRATIRVQKLVDGSPAGGWTITAGDPTPSGGISPSSITTDATTPKDFTLTRVPAAGATVRLDETNQPGHTQGTVTCTGPGATQRGAAGAISVSVDPNETWVCTFANTVNTATIRVVKEVDGVQAAGWTVAATGPQAPMTVAPGQVTTVAAGTVDFGLRTVGAGGSSVQLTEQAQAGFSVGAVRCTGPRATQNGSGGAVQVRVEPGETWTCTFTNTRNRATFQVRKDFSDDSAADVTVGVVCSSGTVTATDATASESDPADFSVVGFTAAGSTTCTATESPVPAGYTSSGSCSASLAAGSCTITNTKVVEVAAFTVGKTFSDGSSISVPVGVVCSSGSVTTVDGTASEADPADFSVSGFTDAASTTCTATETLVPDGYTSSGSCRASLDAGSCTITNTLNSAPFVVAKDFSDDSAVVVPVSLTCSSGTVVVDDPAASESDPARFTVNGFTSEAGTTCTATETLVPDGYTSSASCSASLAAGACTITNTAVIEVKGEVAIRTVSSVRNRALVAGEILILSGRAPADCELILRIDGERQGPVPIGRDGRFEIQYRTTDLAAGRHLAEVVCLGRGVVLSKVFWVATPVGSSSIVIVVLASLLVLFLIGFVGVRTLVDG